ncbi:D-3-phosphoglycerate dehydrogenase [Labilithrix luteola]|uniref:D-3-phosphoglycerate dehydrogenase n=1 Tax=Labilithrix luteola TaxID=1391654 RepID=A0A0K1PIW8_9BACT|nr:D-2-hydroxyacid dehydrogenase [Labilithrix luteola]AKU93488.1 D-3-phosphoglycerate dehydrogenase [Labilithrix luteola]
MPSSTPLRITVALAPDSNDGATLREALVPFGPRVSLSFSSELGAEIEDAEVIVAQSLSDEQVARAKRLRWFASWAAGVDKSARPGLLERKILLTNASGVHGPNIAEHVMAMMLMFTRGMHLFVRAQLEKTWDRPPGDRSGNASELSGQTLAIVGLGRIGEALAERTRPFGMHVIGLKRDPKSRHDERVGVDEVVGLSELDSVLARAHHVCILVPLTRDTYHLFDEARLSRMRSDAYLYNVARGPIVDETALAKVLAEGRIGGAGLDVFEEEPLPKASALWGMKNVILTPHVAGFTPWYFSRFAPIFTANVTRYLAGEQLENLFDPSRGY